MGGTRLIFVTVGTHEQPFNRLIQYIDELKRDSEIDEEVFIQTGYSTYEPKYCQWSKMISYNEMLKKVEEARIVITHGGPASFIIPLQIGKIPIVVPRKQEYGEHINNHQVEFTRKIAKIKGNIIIVENIQILGIVISQYEKSVNDMGVELQLNNKKFCDDFFQIVQDIR